MSTVLDGLEKVARGATYEWNGSAHARVNRVAGDGTWADFTMTRGGSSWGKRMPLPLPETFVRTA